MANPAAPVRQLVLTRPQTTVDTLRGEVIRKALHLLIALVPLLASFNLQATISLLAAGTLFYVFAEKMRIAGRPVFIVSDLTVLASREHDRGRFVIGPVTLGLGAMLALLLYPSTAAAIAVYALAFGDGLASLAGKLFQTARDPGNSRQDDRRQPGLLCGRAAELPAPDRQPPERRFCWRWRPRPWK